MKPNKIKTDILLITALFEERKWIQELFKGAEWVEIEKEGIFFHTCIYKRNDAVIKISLVTQIQMGMTHAAVLTTRSINILDPEIVIMTGICAGVKGKVELGDLIIGSKIFDYGSGKIVEGKLRPHFEPVMLDGWLWQLLDIMRNDQEVVRSIKSEFPLTQPDERQLSIRIGSLGCGAAVVSDGGFVEGVLASERKLLGLDMESYAVALATSLLTTPSKRIECFVIKGVVDFADAQKNDNYHEFGAYASAAFVKKFIDRYYVQVVLNNRF